VPKEKIFRIVRKRIMEDNLERQALSLRFPVLLPLILGGRRLLNNAINKINFKITKNSSKDFFDCVIARHSSPLFRKLGESDPELQIGKIKNLEIAIKSLQGLIIKPGQTFSFWNAVGPTNEKYGYVKGMLISNGWVVEGVGGGLCQLSNLLYWLFLHLPVEVIERSHHSRDVFPDSGRNIPFGTGATVFYNLIDLKVKNTFKYPIQLKLWLSDNQLKGQILSSHFVSEKVHLKEKNHCFIKTPKGVYRYNEIWRETLVEGLVVREEQILTNCAKVMYKPETIDLYLD